MSSVRKVHAERIVPYTVVAGRPFKISYLVRSRRRWSRSWALRVGEMPTLQRCRYLNPVFVPLLEPGEEKRLELSGVLPHRGKVKLAGVRISSRFPFSLAVCTVDLVAPMELIVYPRIGRFRRNPWKESMATESASSGLQRGQRQEEFYGLREYRQGDNYRWIHWRRSARTGVLLVREMAPVRQRRLIVVVDPWPEMQLSKPSGGWKRAKLPFFDSQVEKAISAAAVAICDASQRGEHVGLIARSLVPVVIAPAGGRSHRQRLLRELALLDPGAEASLQDLVGGVRWSSGWQARCVFCATRICQPHRQVLNFVRRQSERLMILSPAREEFNALVDLSGSPRGERRNV